MPENWRSLSWGELATLEYGKGLRQYNDGDYPVFGTNGQIGWHTEPLYRFPGVIIGRKGAYRGVHYSKKPFFVIDTAFYLKPKVEYDTKWAYYQLLNFDVNNIDSGTAIPSTSRDAFYAIPVDVPPLPIQRKIAAVLSTYDDLIEVNTRRISLLEKMAQAIYRKWFGSVDVESLPDGWKVNTFSDVCNEIIDGDWIETKDQGGEDYRLLQVSNIGLGEFIEKGNYRYITQETFDRLNCQEVVPGDILVSRMPTPIGRGWLVTEMPWRMITAVDVAIVRPNPEVLNPFYCVHWLNSPETLAKSEQNSTGTTRPRITRRVLSGFDLVVPPIELQNEFGKIAGDMYEMQTVLRRKNANLRRTRDLLLPRLVIGDVNVSELHIRGVDDND